MFKDFCNNPVMIVSYYFPPLNFPRSIRIKFLLRTFQRIGKKVICLTAHLDNWGIDKTLTDMHGAEVIKAQSHLFRRSIRIHILPHYYLGWSLVPLLKGLVTARRIHPSYVFGIGMPFNSPVIAYLISKITMRPLIIELGDPWSLNPDPVEHPIGVFNVKIMRMIERAVFTQADAVYVTTDKVLDDYSRLYPSIANRFHISRNGFSSEAMNQALPVPLPGNGIKILFLGAHWTGRISIEPLREAIKILRAQGMEIQALFVGLFDDKLCSEGLIHMENMEFGTALGMMKSADILLTYATVAGSLIPSKTYWYLSTGRPTLIIIDGHDVMEKEFRSFPTMNIIQNNTDEIMLAIRKLIVMKKIDVGPIERYDLDITMEKYIRNLDSIVEEVVG